MTREEIVVALSARCVALTTEVGHALGEEFHRQTFEQRDRHPQELLLEIRSMADDAIASGLFA